jgi:hypothetical protein
MYIFILFCIAEKDVKVKRKLEYSRLEEFCRAFRRRKNSQYTLPLYRFIEGQAFLRWYSVATENVRQFDDGGGVWHRVKLNARKKAWFSVNHSILSPMSPNTCPSFANSLQIFSATTRRKIRPLWKTIRSPSNFHLLKEFGRSGKIIIFLGFL